MKLRDFFQQHMDDVVEVSYNGDTIDLESLKQDYDGRLDDYFGASWMNAEADSHDDGSIMHHEWVSVRDDGADDLVYYTVSREPTIAELEAEIARLRTKQEVTA